jgi:alpha-1,3-mannosyltransferase
MLRQRVFSHLQRLLGGRLRSHPHGSTGEARIRRGTCHLRGSSSRCYHAHARHPPTRWTNYIQPQRVFDIIHPSRRNLTAIRGYARLGGLPDNPRTDPQDRSWFGPHDRLFTEEEGEPIDFVPGPHEGACPPFFFLPLMSDT